MSLIIDSARPANVNDSRAAGFCNNCRAADSVTAAELISFVNGNVTPLVVAPHLYAARRFGHHRRLNVRVLENLLIAGTLYVQRSNEQLAGVGNRTKAPLVGRGE